MPTSFDPISKDTTYLVGQIYDARWREDGEYLVANRGNSFIIFDKDAGLTYNTSRVDTGMPNSQFAIPMFRTGFGIANLILYNGTSFFYYLHWDGTKYVYNAGNYIAELYAGANDIDISPDGEHVAVPVNGNIYVFDLAQGSGGNGGINSSPLIWNFGGGTWYGSRYSPDGQYLAMSQSGVGFRVYKRTGDTYTACTISGQSSAFDGAVDWSPDGNQILVSARGTAGTGFTVYNRSGDTFTRDTTVRGPTNGGCVARYCGAAGDRILCINDFTTPDHKLYSVAAGVITLETLPSALPRSQTMEVCKTDKSRVALTHIASPYLTLIQIDTSEPPDEATIDVHYAQYGIAATGQFEAKITSALNYAQFFANGALDVPIVVSGTPTYPVFEIDSVAGAFERAYSTIEWKANAVIGAFGDTELSIDDPEPFTFGYEVYPAFAINASFNINSDGEGVVTYPKFEILGGKNPDVESVEVVYPIYGVDIELLNTNEVTMALNYPTFGVDYDLRLTSTSDSDELVYPEFLIASRVTTNVAKTDPDWLYPIFQFSGLVVRPEVFAEYEYPRYGVDFELLTAYVTAGITYPTFEVDGETGNTRGIWIDYTFAAFEVAAEVYQPIWIDSQYAYPRFEIAADINAPIGSMTSAIYSKYDIEGAGGVFVSISNSDPKYPTFKAEGTLQFTTSIDVLAIYPKYRIEASSANVPMGDGVVIYPQFNAQAEAENYYGVGIEPHVMEVTSEIDAERQKSRRNLMISEK